MTVSVKFNVFGAYTHGKKAGEINPKAKATMLFRADDVKAAVKKMSKETSGAFYIIAEVRQVKELNYASA